MKCYYYEQTMQKSGFQSYIINLSTANGDARLENGSRHNEGQVELYVDGQWKGLCVNDRTLQNGNVACRQLGYGTADGILVSSEFGTPSSPRNTLDVACFGNETSLTDCPVRDRASSNCTHSSQALAVKCSMAGKSLLHVQLTC